MVLRTRSNRPDAAQRVPARSPAVVAGGARTDFLTVRHLCAVGTDRQIGQALAEAARLTFGDAAGPHRAADRTVQKARRRWFEINHPVLAERMVGVADVFGVEAGDDGWDLGRLGPVEAPAGCSAVSYPGSRTRDGHALVARNFDFPTGTYSDVVGLPPTPGESPLAADPWVLEIRPDRGYASVVVGIMDMMGGMDGVNEAGLAVILLADNESPAAEPSVVPQVGLSEQQVVRFLLETCQDVEEAKQALLLAKQYYIFVPCHFLVADRSGRSFVWEYSPGHNREHIIEAPVSGTMVCTNHLLHRWPDPAELPRDPVSAGTAAFTYDRWRTLDSAAAEGRLEAVPTLRRHLDAVRFVHPTPGVRTLWQSVYDLDEAAVEIAFFTGDREGRSRYAEPLRFELSDA